MNKARAPLELQRLTDNGNSVGGIAPLYASVEVAQSDHKDFLTQQATQQVTQQVRVWGCGVGG